MSVLVAGGGPAGSKVAELLAKNGIKVFLVEKITDPKNNAFSSAVLPIGSIKDHEIPLKSISQYWYEWQLVDPYGNFHNWSSSKALGAVLDFGELRKQLWNKAEKAGVIMLIGWKVISVISNLNQASVVLIGPDGERQERKVGWVIDATGFRRDLITSGLNNIDKLTNKNHITGHGIEWILDGKDYKCSLWDNKINFFLGTKWLKFGYGWIFPMSNKRLKIGVCRLPPPKENHSLIPLNRLLSKLIKECDLNKLPILERHGGTLSSSINRSDPHLRGRVIAVGDAVSTANLLGGEGIRHALTSAEVLAEILIKVLNSFDSTNAYKDEINSMYQSQLSKRLGWRWNISGKIAKKTWWGLCNDKADIRIKKIIDGMANNSSAEDLSALLFDYRFESYGFRLLPYILGLK